MVNDTSMDVNTICLPSGDQSGSVGLDTPRWKSAGVLPRRRDLPERTTLIFFCLRNKSIAVRRPAGRGFILSRGRQLLQPAPIRIANITSGLPLLLRIIATFEPSGETAALVLRPE
jgi:hypothetical protein